MFVSKAGRLARCTLPNILALKVRGMRATTHLNTSEGARSVSSFTPKPVRKVSRPPEPTFKSVVWTSFIDAAPRRKAAVEKKLVKMGVVPAGFRLHHASNGTNLAPVLHDSHKKYGFIAITPFAPALEELIYFVRGINDAQKEEYDRTGIVRTRELWQPQHPVFKNTFYDVVIMFPEYFLPDNGSIDVSSGPDGQTTPYCVGYDGALRQAPGLTDADPCLEPIPQPPRKLEDTMNPLLVAMHADAQFRRFFSIPAGERPALHLEDMWLIWKTRELVDHIYLNPGFPQSEEAQQERKKFLGRL